LQFALHASHAPLHGSLQQTPSTQNPLWQFLVHFKGSAQSFAEHVWPLSLDDTQMLPSDAALQNIPLGHIESERHFAGQLPLTPSQRILPLHAGDPTVPEESGVQIPLRCAPRAALHTSHQPSHSASQQTPSTQV